MSRGSATCYQCRRRKVTQPRDSLFPALLWLTALYKVHCERGEPGNTCHNCGRLGFECSFRRSGDDGPAATGLDPEPRRGKSACIKCRMQKTKCSGDFPQCMSCAIKGWSCAYLEPKRGHKSRNDNAGSKGSQDAESPSESQASYTNTKPESERLATLFAPSSSQDNASSIWRFSPGGPVAGPSGHMSVRTHVMPSYVLFEHEVGNTGDSIR